MKDLLLVCLAAGALSFLVVVVTSTLVAEHTNAQLPRAFLMGSEVRRIGPKSLLVELPWSIAILGGGEVVMALFLVHPDSTIPVRFLSAVQLIAAGGWFVYLGTLISRSK